MPKAPAAPCAKMLVRKGHPYRIARIVNLPANYEGVLHGTWLEKDESGTIVQEIARGSDAEVGAMLARLMGAGMARDVATATSLAHYLAEVGFALAAGADEAGSPAGFVVFAPLGQDVSMWLLDRYIEKLVGERDGAPAVWALNFKRPSCVVEVIAAQLGRGAIDTKQATDLLARRLDARDLAKQMVKLLCQTMPRASGTTLASGQAGGR